MVDLVEIAQTAGWLGGGLGATVWGLDRLIRAIATLESAPARVKQWGTHRAEDIVVANVRAGNIRRLADKTDLILAAVTPNGGSSMMDAVNRIEKKLDDHIVSSDKVEEAVFDQMAEQGREIDALTRKVRGLADKRGPDAAPTEGT